MSFVSCGNNKSQSTEQRAGSRNQEARTTQHEARNRLTEAHRMLPKLYGWFTVGFETEDLRTASALLDEGAE